MARRPSGRAAAKVAAWHPATIVLLAAAAFLLVTLDDRHAGRISDECQMVYSAVAIAERGSLGLAPDLRLFNPAERPDGTLVSRYGMGNTLVQLPAALLAPLVERRLGPGTSPPLFLVAPILLVLAAGWAAGALARLLGASPFSQAVAVALATVASPLASYGSSVLSEPLQAASLVGALAAALAAADASRAGEAARASGGSSPDGRRVLLLSAAAGALAGCAVLAKSVLLVAAPPLLLPLVFPGGRERVRRVVAAAAGAALPLGAWTAFELARFGRLLGGYAGESFSHPLLDGLARLLVFPNRGLLLFYPAAALSAAALVRMAAARSESAPRRLAAAGAGLSFAALLVTSATWWCWHGIVGWGPRLLVPAVPFLAPFAALLLAPRSEGEGGRHRPARSLRAASVAIVGLCLAVSLPPLFANPASVTGFVSSCPRGRISEETARGLPPYLVSKDEAGRPLAAANLVLPLAPSASPFAASLWFAGASYSAPARAAASLRLPPWRYAHPEIAPPPFLDPAAEIPRVAPPPRWGWGRTFASGLSDPAVVPLYLDALSNQVEAALDADGKGTASAAAPASSPARALALALAEKLRGLRPGGDSDAYLLEALRRAGRRERGADFVRSLDPRSRSWPLTAAAVALFARDVGSLDTAVRAMKAAAAGEGDPSGPFARLAAKPPSEWPADLLSARGRFVSSLTTAAAAAAPGGPATAR